MRLQPPKNWHKKSMNTSEFVDYIYSHILLTQDKEIPFLEFFNDLCDQHGEKKACEMAVTLFPMQFQEVVFQILNRYKCEFTTGSL